MKPGPSADFLRYEDKSRVAGLFSVHAAVFGAFRVFFNVELPWQTSHENLGCFDLRPVPKRSFDEFRTKTATLGRCLTAFKGLGREECYVDGLASADAIAFPRSDLCD